jgi:hypothetical protein
MHIHAGSAHDFLSSTCYGAVDVRDDDDARVSLAELQRQLRKLEVDLKPCDINAARSVNIIYQAGRGVCIDCDLPKDQWSGFSSITIIQAGHEVAAVEWQGSGARSGLGLLNQFSRDLAELIRAGRVRRGGPGT